MLPYHPGTKPPAKRAHDKKSMQQRKEAEKEKVEKREEGHEENMKKQQEEEKEDKKEEKEDKKEDKKEEEKEEEKEEDRSEKGDKGPKEQVALDSEPAKKESKVSRLTLPAPCTHVRCLPRARMLLLHSRIAPTLFLRL